MQFRMKIRAKLGGVGGPGYNLEPSILIEISESQEELQRKLSNMPTKKKAQAAKAQNALLAKSGQVSSRQA